MLVDPEVLRAFAAEVDAAAEAVGSLDVGDTVIHAADGLSGSETQWSARQVGSHLGLVANDIMRGVTAMGIAVRGAGDRYQVTDDDLAADFTQLF